MTTINMASPAGLVAFLTARGDLPSAWRDTFASVPRGLFVPDAVWVKADRPLTPLLRSADSDAWLTHVYADEPITTQLDDGATAPGERGLIPTSSSSMPSIVAMMLDALDVRDGDQVLEIGTGTGWNAALLCHRLGAANVTSIEVDPTVAAAASKALAAAGYAPTLVVGDGVAGVPDHAPFDRIIVTAAARTIPYAWVAQTRPGGRIVVPFGTAYYDGALARLDVHPDGTASGHFGGNTGFMWLRDQRLPTGWLAAHAPETLDAPEITTTLHPYEPISDFDCSFAIGLHLPDVRVVIYQGARAEPNFFEIWLFQPATGSMATIAAPEPGVTEFAVRQVGPNRLFDQIETTYTWWVDQGRPDHTRFGLTITPDGQQAWYRHPDHPVGPFTPTG